MLVLRVPLLKKNCPLVIGTKLLKLVRLLLLALAALFSRNELTGPVNGEL